jgi:protein-tyrosine phosphatase
MLRSFDPAVIGSDLLDQGIEDPWYGGQADFDAAWQQIHGAVPGIVGHVSKVLRQEAPRRQLIR